jgi:very-short-patch-repair endonuclease
MKSDRKSPPDKEDLGGFPYVPYNTELKELARENRKKPTQSEQKMWNELFRNKQCANLKFHRQKPLYEFIADFYCSQLKLAVEIDGESHLEKEALQYDKERTEILNSLGIKVIRYTNYDVLNNFEEVYKNILKEVNERKKELEM